MNELKEVLKSIALAPLSDKEIGKMEMRSQAALAAEYYCVDGDDCGIKQPKCRCCKAAERIRAIKI
jgi:hypothetical protein